MLRADVPPVGNATIVGERRHRRWELPSYWERTYRRWE